MNSIEKEDYEMCIAELGKVQRDPISKLFLDYFFDSQWFSSENYINEHVIFIVVLQHLNIIFHW